MRVTNSFVSIINFSTVALPSGETFTGEGEICSDFPSVTTSVKTDQSGILFMEFSPDGVNWNHSLNFLVTANINEVHRLSIVNKFYRARFHNTSNSNQTTFHLQTLYGNQNLITSTLNSALLPNNDAIVSRTITEESLIIEGKYIGRSIVNKFGRNMNINTNSLPEDVWDGPGIYTGFPTGAAEEFEAFSSSNSDTGILTITYLASAVATSYTTASVTLTGTTPVSFNTSGIRIHTANYASGSATGLNVGIITVRHKITTSNVFFEMQVGRSQTNVAAYTVPFNSTGYIKRVFCRVIGATTSLVEGSLWIRPNNLSPRLRRPFSCSNSVAFEESPYGGLVIAPLSDIQIRIFSVSSSNTDIIAGYDIVLVSNS